MRLAAPCVVVVALATAGPGHADEPQSGTVDVASRLFLVGEVPFESEQIPDFLPLSSVPWLRDLTLADPLIEGAVLHIQRPPSPPAWLIGPEGVGANYGNVDGVPEVFRAEGLRAETTPELPGQSFYFRPEASASDFMLRCGDPDLEAATFLFCSLNATYPLDPALLLVARIYYPPPFPELTGRLEPMVARMREIALCLDVTEAPPADPEAALAALLAANPRLQGCGVRFLS